LRTDESKNSPGYVDKPEEENDKGCQEHEQTSGEEPAIIGDAAFKRRYLLTQLHLRERHGILTKMAFALGKRSVNRGS